VVVFSGCLGGRDPLFGLRALRIGDHQVDQPPLRDWRDLPISLGAQPSELGFYFINLANLVEKH